MKKSLIGLRFGYLTVIADETSRVGAKGRKQTVWRCKCDCGNEIVVLTNSLRGGRTKSCGCKKAEMISNANTKHKGINDRLYTVWAGMKSRCYNPRNTHYQNYGGRGITICEEWRGDYASFKKWALQSGYDPAAEAKKCTIDRIDNDGNYEPNNCRWVGMDIQNKNKGLSRLARMIEHEGQTKQLCEWARETGIKPTTISERLRRGWSVAEALTTPILPPTAGRLRR